MIVKKGMTLPDNLMFTFVLCTWQRCSDSHYSFYNHDKRLNSCFFISLRL